MSYFLSFIIPAYNRAWCLAECLDGVLAQARADVEIVVVDDGSADGTPGLLERYSARGVQGLRLPENSGPGRARNAGMEKARGEYLVFLDSDDRLLPGGLEEMRRAIVRTERAYAAYWFNCIGSRTGAPTGRAPSVRFEMDYECLLRGEAVRGEFLPVVRRAEFAKVGYVEECRGGEDLAWLELARRAGPVLVCAAPPVRWYRQDAPDSLLRLDAAVTAAGMRNMLCRAETFLKRFGADARRLNPGRRRAEHYRAAYSAVYLRDYEAARRHLEVLRAESDRSIRVRILGWCCRLRSRAPQTVMRFLGRMFRIS